MKRFNASRLEIILSLAVFCGLIYMVYLFGLDGSGKGSTLPPPLTSAAQSTLDRIIARQAELSRSVRELVIELKSLKDTPGAGQKLAGLQKKLDEISNALDHLEARLGEISSLLPTDREPD
jgi:hypothetical protein